MEFQCPPRHLISPGVVRQGLAPDLGQPRVVQQPHGEGEGGGGQEAGGHRHHGVGAKRQLHDVSRQKYSWTKVSNLVWILLGQGVRSGLHAARLAGAPQEVERQRSAEVELEDAEDVHLHLEDLPLGVGAVRDVDEVLDLGRVDLLVLGGHQHRGHAHQLQLGSRHRATTHLHLQVPRQRLGDSSTEYAT